MEKNINDCFSRNLKKVRKALGLTQEELAQKINTTKQTIFRYERGDVNPNLNTLINLKSVFRINLNWLLGDENKEKLHESVEGLGFSKSRNGSK